MKSFLAFVLLFLLFSISITAQEETLLGSGEISSGGFGAPVVKYTQIKGEPALLVGGRGGWIINHTFVIGGGGYGLVNNILGNPPYALYSDPQIVSQLWPLITTYITFGYGGLELEYIIQSDQLLHFSVYTLIGAGAITYRNGDYRPILVDYDYPSDAFFVLEPAVNAELNVASFMRISAGFSYRFISGVKLGDLVTATWREYRVY